LVECLSYAIPVEAAFEASFQSIFKAASRDLQQKFKAAALIG